jgi:hypothetical protein
MKRALLASIWLVVACGPGRPAVVFQGSSEPPVVTPAEVGRAPAVPRDGKQLGKLSVSCSSEIAFEAFEDRSLADVDCSRARLTRMLDEAASAAGGDLLVDLVCHRQSSSLVCEATLARRASRVARARVAPSAGDVFGQLGAEIRISFAPSAPSPQRPARGIDVVRELPVLPPSHRVVGSLEARCEAACPELAVRDGLRIAAGRLGLEEVVAVRCFGWSGGHRCLGTAAVAERSEG